MKNNSNNPLLTPSGLLSGRLRFNSFNSPFISPLQIVQSPCLNDGNLLDSGFGNQFNHFQLEDNNGVENQNQYQQINENIQEEEDSSSLRCPSLPELEHSKDILLDQNNMLEFVLNHVNRRPQMIDQTRQSLQTYGTEFNKKLFDYLINKFKKLRKTKQEMVKYCIRKSFKHITNKMRAANKQAYVNMENNEVVGEYFQMNCQNDASISMPFKKDSQEKTMNSNFLKKIFKCRQYNIDYKEFMKQFPSEFNHDNKKKIKSMNEAIKKCSRNKCFKSLDQYKRLPWPIDLLEKIFDFAKQLMQHSPFKSKNLEKNKLESNNNSSENNSQDEARKKIEQPFHIQSIHPHTSNKIQHQNSGFHDQFDIIRNVNGHKKSVIILTPTNRPVEPTNNKDIPQMDLLE